MVYYCKGDMLVCGADVLVNPVNLEGVAGRGLAATFKRLYPAQNAAYVEACRSGQLSIGSILVLPATSMYLNRPIKIVYAPTKTVWRQRSTVEYIESSLRAIAEQFPTWGTRSIALPALGCGLGGLNFNKDVSPLITAIMGNLPATVYSFLPA